MVQAAFDGLTGLVRLIYASRWNVPEGRALDEEVRKIVIASMNNNRLVNVTGLLLVHDGWFVQALEGPAASVRETYERVAKDERHTEVTLLEVAPAKARAFRDWNMTERRLTALQGPILARFGQEEAFDPAKLTGKQAFELLSALGIAYAA
jgi:hypothetical protein